MNIIELTAKLISYKTVSGNHEEVKKCYDFIKEYLGKDFYYKDIVYNDFLSLIISTRPDFENFDILFNGHIDVVSAKEEDFTAKIVGDKLFGRGSIDMKGQIACILHLLKNNKFDKNIGLILTSDEEIGGHNGAEQIVKDLRLQTKLLIVPDAGENFTFVDSEKALLQADFVTIGLSAHASLANEGINAILQAIEIYKELCDIYNLDYNSPVGENISINLAKISSGDLYNKVPDVATWSLDIRYSNLSSKDLEDSIRQVCEKHKTSYTIHNQAEEFVCDINNKEVQRFIDICEKELGRKIEHIKVNGASDIHYFSSIGLAGVSINPEGYNLHSENEYVVISSLERFENLLIKYINA